MSYEDARQHVLELLPKGDVGAEIGVFEGNFSAQILDVAKPRKLHLIDPWVTSHDPTHSEAWYGAQAGVDMAALRETVELRFENEIRCGIVEIHPQKSCDALLKLQRGSLGFVYVDGDHAYDGIKSDLELGFHACRSGALICIDDHCLGRWWNDGIVRAANEFLGAHADQCEIIFCYSTQLVIRRC